MAEPEKFKIFDLWDISSVEVTEPGLKSVINLDPRLTLKNQGRNVVKGGQTKVNIIERLANRLAVSGHRNKKHKLELGRNTGKYSKNMNTVIEVFKIIEEKKKENPIQVFVVAIEKAAPRDETTVIEYGGARYPQAVDIAPIRRINIALRNMIHAASDKAFNKKKTIAEALAEEIILTYDENGDSVSLRRKNESEKQADAAR